MNLLRRTNGKHSSMPPFSMPDTNCSNIRFPLPEIPPGWKPNPKSVKVQDSEKATTTPSLAKVPDGKWRSHLSADQVCWKIEYN